MTNDDMEKSRAIIESRVNALGASEAVVQVQGTDQILVQIPIHEHRGRAEHHRQNRQAEFAPRLVHRRGREAEDRERPGFRRGTCPTTWAC
ncbi:MAG: hypothetical protein ACLTMP_08290 [Eggerthella lenta]